jgi:hypothetical protein
VTDKPKKDTGSGDAAPQRRVGISNEVAASTPPSTDSESDRIKWPSDVGQGHPYGSSGDAKRA